MPKYKKCPRCELNYILETEDYCPVCKDELSGVATNDLDYDEAFERICPRCGINPITEDQEYCDACRADMEALSVDMETEEEEEWQKSAKESEVAFPDIDDEAEDEELDPALVLEDPDILAELESEEEADAELDKEEEEYADEVDDFDDFEDLGDLDDYDEDDEDDFDEDGDPDDD